MTEHSYVPQNGNLQGHDSHIICVMKFC